MGLGTKAIRPEAASGGPDAMPIGGVLILEVVGIVIALIAALFVLFHARLRQLPLWAAIGWALGTFFLLIVALPIYLLVHGPEPKRQESDS